MQHSSSGNLDEHLLAGLVCELEGVHPVPGTRPHSVTGSCCHHNRHRHHSFTTTFHQLSNSKICFPSSLEPNAVLDDTLSGGSAENS